MTLMSRSRRNCPKIARVLEFPTRTDLFITAFWETRRRLALGHALQRAIRNWKGHTRIAVVASGGLTHFVIDEEFDQTVLAAMERGDEDALSRLPESYFRVGTAEIKNWL